MEMRIVSTAFVHELIYVFNSFFPALFLFMLLLFRCMEYYNLLTLSCIHSTHKHKLTHRSGMTTNAHAVHTHCTH